jgi:hypothetical protein
VLYAHDIEASLIGSAALVNTLLDGEETLTDAAALARFTTRYRFSGDLTGTDAELAAVRAVRARVAGFWPTAADTPDTADPPDTLDTPETGRAAAAAGLVNRLLADTDARPYLVDHDDWGWHLHVTPRQAPTADRIGADVAMAVAELVRAGDLDRLRRCAADDCDAVLVDLSRNRSKRYCDTGNCANRAHVAAYRARRSEQFRAAT